MLLIFAILQLIIQMIFFKALVSIEEDDTDVETPADIYAVGFQEMVDLNASNIIAAR